MQTILTPSVLACIDNLSQATNTHADIIKDNLIKAIHDSDFTSTDPDNVNKTKEAVEFALQACINAGLNTSVPYDSITDIINLSIYHGNWWYKKANDDYSSIPHKFMVARRAAFELVTNTIYDFVRE